MTLTKTIAHNTAIQIIGKAVSTLLGLLAVAIMTRYLGVEQFGWYITASSWLLFVGVISDFGFTLLTAKMLSEPEHDKTKLLHSLFTWRFISALIFNGLAPLIILFFPYPAAIKLAVAILAVSFFCIALNQIFTGYYQTKLKMLIQMTAEVLSRLVLVGGLLLMVINQASFLPIVIVVTMAATVYTFYLWLRSPGVKFCFDKIIAQDILKKIWPMAVAVMFNAVYLQGDKVILPLYVSQIDMGLYGAAYRVLDMVTQITAMLMGLMMPLIAYAWSRRLPTEFKKYYQMSFDLISLIILPMVAGIMALATPIMKLVAGSEFAQSGAILKILILTAVGIILGMTGGHIALAINRQKQSMWIYITAALISLPAYFIFIPRYGVWGAVGVSLFAEIYVGLGTLILVAHYTNYWPQLKALIKIVLASAIMGYLVYIIPSPHVLISVFYGMIIYIILVLAFRVVSKQTIEEIISNKKDLPENR